MRAQFNGAFHKIGALRRRRAELEYPTAPGDMASEEEAAGAIEDATAIADAAEKLLPTLSFYR